MTDGGRVGGSALCRGTRGPHSRIVTRHGARGDNGLRATGILRASPSLPFSPAQSHTHHHFNCSRCPMSLRHGVHPRAVCLHRLQGIFPGVDGALDGRGCGGDRPLTVAGFCCSGGTSKPNVPRLQLTCPETGRCAVVVIVVFVVVVVWHTFAPAPTGLLRLSRPLAGGSLDAPAAARMVCNRRDAPMLHAKKVEIQVKKPLSECVDDSVVRCMQLKRCWSR